MRARAILRTAVCVGAALLLSVAMRGWQGLPTWWSTAHDSVVSKVLVVVEENHSITQVLRRMPTLARLAETYGYATHWKALAHPSLPNYLGIAAGSTFGIADDGSPARHASDVGSARSVFDQAIGAGKTAGAYAEAMPGSCHLVDSPRRSRGTPTYDVQVNPWAYFTRGRAGCVAHDRGLSAFAGDAARNRLPDIAFLIPDLRHDGHSGSLATADHWLRRRLAPVLSSADFTSGRLVVVVTTDEDDRHSGNSVLTAVLTPRLDHKVVTSDLTHYSLTRFIDEVLGVPPLRHAATAPDMRRAFGL
jgi:acid phosphatase